MKLPDSCSSRNQLLIFFSMYYIAAKAKCLVSPRNRVVVEKSISATTAAGSVNYYYCVTFAKMIDVAKL